MIATRWTFVRPAVGKVVWAGVWMGVLTLVLNSAFSLPLVLQISEAVYPTRLELVDESGRLTDHVAERLPRFATLDLARGGRAAEEDVAAVLARVQAGDVEGALWVDEITAVDGSARWVANRRPDDATLWAMDRLAAVAARSRIAQEGGIPAWTLAPSTGARVVVERVEGAPVPELQRAVEVISWAVDVGWWVIAVAPAAVGVWVWTILVGAAALSWSPAEEAARHRQELHALHAGAKWTFETTVGTAALWAMLGTLVPGLAFAPILMVAASLDSLSEARWAVLGTAIAWGATAGVIVGLPRTLGPIISNLGGPGWFNLLGSLSSLTSVISVAGGVLFMVGGTSPLAVVAAPGLGPIWGWVAAADLRPTVVAVLVANTALTLWACHRALHHLVRVRDVMGDLDVWIDGHLPRFLAVGRDED